MIGRAGLFRRVLRGNVGVVLTGLVLAGTGCAADSSSSSGGFSYASGGGSSSGTSGASTQPMLVVVDTNQTMNASPGQGVGVFVQYQSGGHWNIWWTCDTDKTALSCNFEVQASSPSGISNLVGRSVQAGDSVWAQNDGEVDATTTTSTGVSGMTFDTPLGASSPVVTVNASVDGANSGSFLFFVQNGKINGGYTGMLTDPLMFEPSSP